MIILENESAEVQENDNSWLLAIKKTGLVIACMAISLFIAIPSTLLYYFLFGVLTDSPQPYPGMEPWQPFWTLCLVIGFLIGLFKSIIDIIDEKFRHFVPDDVDRNTD